MNSQDQSSNQLIADGLLKNQAVLPPKLFYDVLGSTLFTAICHAPEYYPTRTEAVIFDRFATEISGHLKRPFRLVDLGAGDCRKAAGLIPALKPAAYTPIDISGDFLNSAAAALAADFPQLTIEPLVRDFTTQWHMPDSMNQDSMLFFYPGSSLGNFAPKEAVEFLTGLHQVAQGEGGCQLLIGLDTVKDASVLEAAYDDALGVTAAFNRNALLNTNRQIGSDFDVSQWAHRSVFNAAQSRVEMHLVARENLTVSWHGAKREFSAGETIHTENSHKYTVDSAREILSKAGFELSAHWTAENNAYLVVLANSEAAKA